MSFAVELTEDQMNQLRAITRQQDVSVAIQQVILEYIHQIKTTRDATPSEQTNDHRALFDLAGQDVVDPEAYKELRAASMI